MILVVLSIISTSALAAEPERKVMDLGDGYYVVETITYGSMGRLICAGALTAVVHALIVTSTHWYRMYQTSKSLNEITVVVEYPPQIITPEEYDAIWKSASEEEKTGVWEELPENTP